MPRDPCDLRDEERTFYYVGQREGKSNAEAFLSSGLYWLGGVLTSSNTMLRYIRSTNFFWSGVIGPFCVSPIAASERRNTSNLSSRVSVFACSGSSSLRPFRWMHCSSAAFRFDSSP